MRSFDGKKPVNGLEDEIVWLESNKGSAKNIDHNSLIIGDRRTNRGVSLAAKTGFEQLGIGSRAG
jgi:hypothetical protein